MLAPLPAVFTYLEPFYFPPFLACFQALLRAVMFQSCFLAHWAGSQGRISWKAAVPSVCLKTSSSSSKNPRTFFLLVQPKEELISQLWGQRRPHLPARTETRGRGLGSG